MNPEHEWCHKYVVLSLDGATLSLPIQDILELMPGNIDLLGKPAALTFTYPCHTDPLK